MLFLIGVLFLVVACAAVVAIIVLVQFKNQKKIDNSIVGWVVMANDEVYRKFAGSSADSDCCCPASVIFSFDDKDGYDDGLMSWVAKKLMELKGEANPQPELLKLHKDLVKEKYIANRILEIPKSLTDGAEIFFAHVKICRRQLAKKKLARDYVRIYVEENNLDGGASFVNYKKEDGKFPVDPDSRKNRDRDRDREED